MDIPSSFSNELPPGRRAPTRPVVRLVRYLVLSTLGMLAISSVALLIYTNGARDPETHTLVIPDGTSELIAAGENPLSIPATWGFLADDTLELVNHDRVGHRFGRYFVPPSTTRAYTLQPAFGGSLACSLHPAGEITIDVELRTFNWRATIFPTLVLGPMVGLVLAGVTSVVGKLDEPDEGGYS